MWKILSKTRSLIVVCLVLFPLTIAAQAEQVTNNFGFNLPNPPLPHGFDEVRAADGTTCRSSIAGNGPILDIGGIGGQGSESNSFDRGTVYGRIVVPLGQKPSRLDCKSLYQLEIDRLKYELRLAQSGNNQGLSAKQEEADWTKSGWDN